jgi:transcriptional regulator
MYVPPHFAVDDEATQPFLSSVQAGDLITSTADGLVATFLPLLHDAERNVLLGHVARKNDQWQRAAQGESLAIVHGVDAYVSPSWYATKAEHGRVVPTWNYTTAHVYGTLRIHDEPEWVDMVVRRLTERHEAGREHPWSVDDAPEQFHAGQLRAIVGVELEITRVEAKFKLSQNRSEADLDGVVSGLEVDGQAAAAAAVEEARA